MCQGLGLQITAEGIERPDQFSMLMGERGMYLQGYLLARPASRDDLIPLLALVAQRAQGLVLELQQAPPLVAAGVAPTTGNPPVNVSANRLLTIVGSSR
jgi:hypothetical protein